MTRRTLLLAISLLIAAGPSVLALDFGNEWLKGCLANQKSSSIGQHLDVVINEQSSRKTPNVLGFDSDNDRVMGDFALPLLFRSPARVFPHVKRLIGKTIQDEATARFMADFPALQLETAPGRPTLQFKSPKANAPALSVEEVAVMLLQLARQQADNHVVANAEAEDVQAVTRAVLSVPEHWSLGQRQLMSQLLQLAGFDAPAAVLGELTSAAIDYAVRNLPTAGSERVVFLGAGTMGVTASLVELTRMGEGAEGEVRVRVIKSASDDSVGGYSYDVAVRDALAKRFDAQHQKGGASITSNPRAMAKLLRESRDLKEMLSASPLVDFAVEELFGGKDFRFSATQDELVGWAAAEGLLEKFMAPLRQVLAGAEAGSVSGIEIVGGAVRVPSIQAAIKDAFPNLPLGKHVDGDEGTLLGAAHYAGVQAGIARLLKVVVDESAVQPAPAASDAALALTPEQEASLRSRIADFDAKAQARRDADAARNTLESSLNDARELLEKAPKAKRAERDALSELIAAASAFLDDSDSATAASSFVDHSTAVAAGMRPLQTARKVEKAEKPSAPRKKRDRRAEHKRAMEEMERQKQKQEQQQKQKQQKASAAEASSKTKAPKTKAKAKDSKPSKTQAKAKRKEEL